MEPFGLFSLLQSLLSPENTQNGRPTTSVPSPHDAENEPFPTMQNSENEPITPMQNSENKETDPYARSDAFLAFMDAHERRAKLTKRKK